MVAFVSCDGRMRCRYPEYTIQKTATEKKRHRDNKNDSIMILSIVCKHMRGGLGCASFFYLNPTAFIRVLLSFFLWKLF